MGGGTIVGEVCNLKKEKIKNLPSPPPPNNKWKHFPALKKFVATKHNCKHTIQMHRLD